MAVKIEVEIVGPNAAGRFDYVVIARRFRAMMERCDRDGCADGSIKPCEREINGEHMHSSGEGSGSVDKWLKHSATHCHGWHDARVAAFMAKVAKTYGSYRGPKLCAPVRRHSGPLGAESVADELGWTVEQYRAELEKAAA